MAHNDGKGGSQADRDDNRGDDNQKEAAERLRLARAVVPPPPVTAPAFLVPPVPGLAPPLVPPGTGGAAPPAEAPPTPVTQAFIGAINRSSGNTGSSLLNAAAVERARLAGTQASALVSSVDGAGAGIIPFTVPGNRIDNSGL